jgi:hypothetical protein
MSTNFIWSVGAVETYPVKDGNEDVIFNVHWTCTGAKSVDIGEVDGNMTSQSYDSRVIGTQHIPPYTESAFIPYDELTHDKILEWTFSAMSGSHDSSREDIESSVEGRIDKVITPPTRKLKLPWTRRKEKKAAADKIVADKKAAADKIVADKKAAADKIVADKKAAADKIAADKIAAEEEVVRE